MDENTHVSALVKAINEEIAELHRAKEDIAQAVLFVDRAVSIIQRMKALLGSNQEAQRACDEVLSVLAEARFGLT